LQKRHGNRPGSRLILATVLLVVITSPGIVDAQTSTGTLTGRVIADGVGLPGATVSLSSDVLQGDRAVVTQTSGDYHFPGLPGGTYTVRFSFDGYRTLEREVKISAAQARVLDAALAPAAVAAEIEVSARYETVASAFTGAETVQQEVQEALAVDRSLEGAVSLAAGTANTGPGRQAVVNGSHSFENLYTMNGIVLNETIRQQPSSIYIEDALQETTVLTNGVSAEYGRFSGGVINTITRSGGNRFTGSLRIGLDNDSWSAATPVTTSQVDTIREIYEATVGGYLWRDRLWFFLAGRDRTIDRSRQTHVTQIPYTQTFDDTRLEAKLTAQVANSHRITTTFSHREWPFTNGGFSDMPSMDLRSLDPLYGLENEAFALNYAGVLSHTVFVEAQFSQHDHTVADVGGDDPSLNGGTPILDFLLDGSFHAPYFCGLPCRDEERDNRNLLAKISWFLSTDTLGTHDLVAGMDSFSNRVLYDNHQSASDYQIWTLFPHDFSTGTPLLNMMPFASLIAYRGILVSAQRTDFRTDSAYVNDTWRITNRVALNLGLRYDRNNGTDAGGSRVVTGDRWSPRLGLSWDLAGDGKWIFNASLGRYTSAIMYTIANAGTSGGRPVEITYLYTGPPVSAVELGSNEAALSEVFDWFFNVYGGLGNPDNFFLPPVIPGLTPVVGDDLGSPFVDEFSLGVAVRLGSNGVFRADYVHRQYSAFYAAETIPNRWVESPLTGPLDLTVYQNEDDLLERTYYGLITRFQYRAGDRWSFGGNWTWSQAVGNWDGESAGDSAFAGDVTEYQEYKDPRWSNPRGDLAVDQRHKLRLWAIWNALATRRHNLSVSLLQSYFSGTPYSAVGIIDNSLGLEYVDNPGYVSPPPLLDYYFSGRGAYTTETITSTDLALNYSFFIPSGSRAVELFVQPEVLNVFNEQGAVGVDMTVFTSESDPNLALFNPLTESPVEGIHWRTGDDFGQPTREGHYQYPRTFRVSIGVRF
jgi:hypothetical protein